MIDMLTLEEREKIVDEIYNLNEINDYNSIEKAINLMGYISNDKLYKYRSVNLNSILNLNNNILPFCSASTLNDPFECGSIFNDIPINIGTYNKVIDDFEKDFKETWHICSLSEKNDDILMWSHYADEHKGFCIEYSFMEIHNEFKLLCLPVKYQNKLPKISITNSKSYEAIFTKAKQWSYEYEWRIAKNYSNANKILTINMPKPKAIYLGCRIEENLKNYLVDFCSTNGIEIYQGIKNRTEYKIDFKKIN